MLGSATTAEGRADRSTMARCFFRAGIQGCFRAFDRTCSVCILSSTGLCGGTVGTFGKIGFATVSVPTFYFGFISSYGKPRFNIFLPPSGFICL